MRSLRFATCIAFLSASLVGPAKAQECEVARHAPIPRMQDLPYAKARQELIRAGWQPTPISPMHRQDGEASSGNGPAFLKLGFDEVEDCSASGLSQCRFGYTDVYGNRLKIITAGEEMPADGLRARVIKWFFECEVE